MTDSTIKNVVTYLIENGFVSEDFASAIEEHLIKYMFCNKKSIFLENVKANFPKLTKYITEMKIKCNGDFSALTLKTTEAEEFIKKIDNFDNLKVSSVREFTTNPELLTKKIEFCEKHNIPYKDEDGVIFQEITDANNGIYLRGYSVDPKTNKRFKDFPDFEKFIDVCAAMQRRIYDSSKVKFLITWEVEELIKNNILMYPDYSASQIANIILTDPENKMFVGLNLDTANTENTENNLFHRNGR